jgi:hypothetical protein
MYTAKKRELAINLSPHALKDAVSDLGCTPGEVIIYCGRRYALEAAEMRSKFGLLYIIVPDDLLKTEETWGIEYHSSVIWSEGF